MRPFRRKLTSLFMSAVLTASAIAAVSVTTGAPAQAANRCQTTFGNDTDTSPYPYSFGPYWWGAKQASAGGTRMVLDVEGPWTFDGANIHIWHWYGGDSQYWCMASQGYYYNGSRVYKIRNLYTGKCLDIDGPSGNLGTRVHQWGCKSYADYRSQQWAQEPFGSGYRFRNVFAGGYCLDIREFGTSDGTPVQIWSCSGADNQTFF